MKAFKQGLTKIKKGATFCQVVFSATMGRHPDRGALVVLFGLLRERIAGSES
jgi:hypothetical protein